ncbi:ComF family protein [Billgrantia endophytica]|uniref:Amidophosphoribosyltransferase n=1 Tax=Billgrantia endophytica TaxID=2033802 RepID=A0A2N7U8Z5_9GAMM|nr:ComF family protein [Halomonas endophytica]PMR76911.1 amidophosphoribosyltransferase [Halomonas endophytica]
MVDGGLRRALPGRCAFCLAPGQGGHPWCESCFESLPWNVPACPGCAEPRPSGTLAGRLCGRCVVTPPRFDKARVPLCYQGEITAMVRRFKFHASPRAGNVLLELLELGLPPKALAWPQALIPVPLHPRRARERGFDQADWLARRLSRRLDIPLVAARRCRDTRSQRGLDRMERRHNLRDGFEVTGRLPGRVALLDDVMTTGATLDALAQACRRAGAEGVEAWAVARTPLL